MKVIRGLIIHLALLTGLILPSVELFSLSDDELDRAAETHFRNGDYPRAVETWKKILDKNPGDEKTKSKLERTFQAQYKAELTRQQEKLNRLQNPSAGENKQLNKELNINWDSVDGAVKYQVQVMDQRNAMVLDRIVDTNVIRFTVPEGEYRMRVGAINIFDKVGAWSDWSDLKIMRRQSPEAMRVRGIIDHGFTFAAGVTYFQLKSDMNELYEDSYNGWTVMAGYRLRNINALSERFFLKNLGIELEMSNITFRGTSLSSIRDNNLEILAGGINIKYTTDFRFPLNLSLRGGIGAAHSTQNYKLPDSGGGIFYDAFRISSTDPYYKAGLSLVADFFSFFIETGCDYYMVDYIAQDLAGIRYYFLAGMKI